MQACTDEDSELERRKLCCLRCPSCRRGVTLDSSDGDSVEGVGCAACGKEVPESHVRRYWEARREVVDVIFRWDDNRRGRAV